MNEQIVSDVDNDYLRNLASRIGSLAYEYKMDGEPFDEAMKHANKTVAKAEELDPDELATRLGKWRSLFPVKPRAGNRSRKVVYFEWCNDNDYVPCDKPIAHFLGLKTAGAIYYYRNELIDEGYEFTKNGKIWDIKHPPEPEPEPERLYSKTEVENIVQKVLDEYTS